MEYTYRTVGIKIGFESFDFYKKGEIERMFRYCEETVGLSGENYEQIKQEYDYEELKELVEEAWYSFDEGISA